MWKPAAVLLGLAGFAAAQTPWNPEQGLAGFLQRMAAILERQPDYTCLETVERTRRSPGGKTQVEDTLRLEVALVGSKEMFAWPGSKEFEDKELADMVTSGMFGNGNFALYPRMLFGPGGPAFIFAGETTVNGRRAAQYNFRVPSALSGYTLSVDGRKAIVGYHGSFFVDLETHDLRRLVIIPDTIPPEFELLAAEDRVDFGRVRIGEEDFLLPVESNLMMTFPDVVSRNRVRFSACRKFTGQSTLVFPEDEPHAEPAAQPVIREVVLPAETTLELVLSSEVSLAASAVGDAVEARLHRDVKSGREVLAPKGATARGRILRLDRTSEFTVLELRFTDLEWPGGRARIHGRFEGLNSASGRAPYYRDPQSGALVILRGGPARLRNLLMRWRTAP